MITLMGITIFVLVVGIVCVTLSAIAAVLPGIIVIVALILLDVLIFKKIFRKIKKK